MKKISIFLSLVLFSTTAANAEYKNEQGYHSNGYTYLASKKKSSEFVKIRSKHSVSKTMSRFESIIKRNRLMVFKKVDYAKSAKKFNVKLRPNQVMFFGSPTIGLKLMRCSPDIAMDLPLKVHVWKDKSGKVWLSYLKPKALKSRYHVRGCDKIFKRMEYGLPKIAKLATK